MRVKSHGKTLIAILLVITLVAVGVKVGIEIYRYNHYQIDIYYMHPYGENFEVQYFGISFQGGSTWFKNQKGNPYALRFDERKQEFMDKVYTFQNEIYTRYVGPANVTATVKNIDGHTVFTYQGTVTSKTGETVVLDERIVLDGILTEHIPGT